MAFFRKYWFTLSIVIAMAALVTWLAATRDHARLPAPSAPPVTTPETTAQAGGVTPEVAAAVRARAAAARAKLFIRKVNELSKTIGAEELSVYITSRAGRNPALIESSLDWARSRTIESLQSRGINSFDFMIYADILFLAAKQAEAQKHEQEFYALTKSAYGALLVFELMLAQDIARCTPPATAPKKALALAEDRFKNLRYAYDIFTLAELEYAWRAAIISERSAKARWPNKAVCSYGTDETDPKFITDTRWQSGRYKIENDHLAKWRYRHQSVQSGLAKP